MGKKSELLNKMLSETDARKDFDLSRKQTDIVDTRFDETKFSSFSLDNDTPDMDEGSDDSEPSPKAFKGNNFFFGREDESPAVQTAPTIAPTPIMEAEPEPIPSQSLFMDTPKVADTEPIPTLPLDEPSEEVPKNNFFTEPTPAPDTTPVPKPEPKVVEKPAPEKKPEPAKKPVQKAQNTISANKGKENVNMDNLTEVEIQILRKILAQTTPNFEGLDYLSEEDLNRIWDTYKNTI